MDATGQRSRWPLRRLAGSLGLILVLGCDVARTPVEPAAEATELPSLEITSVASATGEAARQAWIDGRTGSGKEVTRQILTTPAHLRTPEVWADGRVVAGTLTFPAETGLGPAMSEAADEDAGIIDFGTQIRMPFGGPFTVVAYTETSRATRISHVIHIKKNVDGRSYESTINDDSGFLHQPALYTTVSVSGDCETPTTLDAQTNHTAGSITFKRQHALSTANGSCGSPARPCDGGGGGPDDVVVQGADGSTVSTSSGCTGGGGGPDGETARYTCYTTVTDYYWYYPDTGTYEYRYSEETTWCEENAA